jgi:error-prone DNA polymerase
VSDGPAALWCKSNFSFLEGASDPEELVEECRRLGIGALALTDRDGVPGLVRAHLAARENGVRLLAGSEISIDDGSTLVLLAADRAGYANLCRLATAGRRRSPKGESRVRWDEVLAHAPGLLALWGGDRSLLAGEEDPAAVAGPLREAFGDRLHAMAARHRRAEEPAAEARLRARAAALGIPVVAATEVLYHEPSRRDLQDVLACVRRGTTLAAAGRLLKPNAGHALPAPAELRTLFADDPGAVERTREIAARCDFSLDRIRYRYPSEDLPDGTTTGEHLRALVLEGARGRCGGTPPPDVAAQLEKELDLIAALDYAGYFLTMHEVVRFCRSRGILCQGRGSAANSAVCWCLGITAVDPVRMGLLFERFLSRERAEPPDIDLDIEHERREEVLRHVYERYGRDRAAMVAVVIRYRPRSAVRDVGRALGLPETALDRLARMLGHHGSVFPEALAGAGLDPEAPLHAHLLRLSNEVLGFPRHLSIHPGGFLLGHEPVHDLVPVENGAMEGRTVIQWDKEDVEALGLFKVDLLGLGALTLLRRCFEQVRSRGGPDLTIATVPAEDPATYDMLCRADAVGVFQVESRAQMAMLPRLKPRRFYDLVVEVSIVRPGPIAGGMVHPYLRRRRGEEPVEYPHECLRPVLEKTLGVPLFQEQVMRLAVVAAGYTPGEADQLRRDMAAWRRGGRLEAHRERLVSRMTARGIAPEFAARVFEQIRGFGEYGFPESHAASFALLAYATAWLKRHHPEAFVCALLNAQPMGFYSPATIVGDARRRGVEVRPPCVARGAFDATLEDGAGGAPAVRVGLRFVKGLGEAEGRRIEEARARGPFAGVDDLAERARLPARALRTLAAAGALEALAPGRRDALWGAAAAGRSPRPPLPMVAEEPEPEFAPLGAAETILWDFQASGLSVRGHPLEPLREELRARGLPDARGVASLRDGARARYAGVVICRQRPGTAAGVVFLSLEDETGFVNVVVWPRVFDRFPVLVRTAAFLGVTGRVQAADGVVHIVAEEVWEPDLGGRAPHAPSHDFH